MLARLGNGAAEEKPSGVAALKVPPAPQQVVAQLRQAGMTVTPVAHGNNLLQVKWWAKSETANKEPFVLLPKLAQQVTWLDLSNATLPAEAWHVLPSLTNLTKLHLQGSNATDATLAGLKNLPHLEYLNLYGTAVSDAGLVHLAGLKNLKSLYLWQTKVTPEGVRQLQQKLPDLRVDRGWEEKGEKAAAGMLGAR
jgi:Leucine-rich repeat (LRR) protein